MKTVLSGIRSTGHLHLGNYFGALRNFVQLQHQAKCYFFVADLHSLTTHPKPDDYLSGVKTILSEYLASGLDPEKSTLYVQSSVPQVCELYVLLNMLTYKGELERTASFKDKVRLNPDNVNAGLLTYPVLMAADILIHRANWVPVGKDQEQHLEITRMLARRFNKLYGAEVFPEPEAYNFGGHLVRIPGLDGSGKMGKSENNGIYLVDDQKTITKKVMRAVTDTGPVNPNDPMSPGVANLFTLLGVVSEPEVVAYFREQYDKCTIRYGDLKKQLAADICKHTLPIKERIEEIYNNGPYLKYVIEKGTEEARTSARATMELVRDAVGFKTF
ncbi:MAG TPA: tryptophan--tRNA ligase [Bacteroidales bacterium]|jgi:tryptophanyl-tRNA synthetase|nr:tryptophan--tRNA ligase [Bacteroidales bacterium]MCZ2416107.1 tryptophan--tRNA ligase [Burkholderiales bacterium]OQC58586.1 MAG: Tryptophan--tRNA ligase [Bacteroidetes bacterium ADurb.Bin013]MBP8999354.1 tryptophan--tRNA ligase [Bacteroidales bacterium]MBV6455153.1 Tryptophan--tRNA ligase [Bacteroidales bacterium]